MCTRACKACEDMCPACRRAWVDDMAAAEAWEAVCARDPARDPSHRWATEAEHRAHVEATTIPAAARRATSCAG